MVRDHRYLVILVVALVLFAAVPFLYADIYMYVDKDGTTCFTNLVPSTPRYHVIIKERKKISGHVRQAGMTNISRRRPGYMVSPFRS